MGVCNPKNISFKNIHQFFLKKDERLCWFVSILPWGKGLMGGV